MKKLTVKEALKLGVKVGDEVWVKRILYNIDETETPFGVHLGHKGNWDVWCTNSDEIYLPEPEAKLETRETQQPEFQEGDTVRIVKVDATKADRDADFAGIEEYIGSTAKIIKIDTDNFARLELDISMWFSIHDLELILTKGTEGPIPQPEADWQPKEGEIVWVNFLESKAEVELSSPGNSRIWVICDEYIKYAFPVPLSEIEPYTNQDEPKVDFSVPGQWLWCGEYGIVKTYGDIDEFEQKCNSDSFAAIHFGAEFKESNTVWCDVARNWRVLAPEEIDPIIEAIRNLKTSGL